MSQTSLETTARKAIASSFDALAPLSSRALFWRAGYVAQSTFLEHIPLLFWIVENARPGMVVSLGLGDAVPYFAACQAIEKLNIEALCLGFAPEDTGDLAAVMAHNAQHFPDFSEISIGERSRMAQGLRGSEIDLLIVNEPLTQALADELDGNWLGLLSDRALVLFAQGGDMDILPRYAERIAIDGGVFIVEAAQGIRLALRGSRHDERLMRLARLQPGKAGYLTVRHVFARIGELHRTSFEMGHASSSLGTARKQRDTAAKELEGKAKQLVETQTKLAQITDQLKTTAGMVATLRSEAFDDKSALAALKSELAESTTATDSLRKSLTELETAHDADQAALSALEGERDTLKAALAESTTAADALRENLTHLEQAQAQQEAVATRLREECAALKRAGETARAERDQRFEELALLTRMLEETRGERDTLKSALAESTTAADALRKNLTQLEQAQAQQEAVATRLRADCAALKRAGESARAERDQRFEELALLTRMLEERDQKLPQQAQMSDMLQHERLHHRTLMQLAAPKEKILIALHGRRVSRPYRQMRAELNKQIAEITQSGLFDAAWYRATYPDIATASIAPIEHFVRAGAYEGRNPGPNFDSLKYHMANPEVAAHKMPALLHYLRHGKAEGRKLFGVTGSIIPDDTGLISQTQKDG